MRIYTIVHSTRTFEDFLVLLAEHGITRLADIRRFPGSRRHPHFSKDSLLHSLPANGVEYLHFEDLGGRRKPSPDSPNTYWELDQFRAYADYMGTREFAAAVDRLLASEQPTVYMCAEAVPWRCHRNLLSDDLVRRGLEVIHILSPGKTGVHAMNKAARVEDGHLVYEGQKRLL